MEGYTTLERGANAMFYRGVIGSSELNGESTISGSVTPPIGPMRVASSTQISADGHYSVSHAFPEGHTLTSVLPLQTLQLLGYEEPQLYYTRTINQKQYELKDHLGNVRAVINDVKSLKDGKLIVGLKAYHNYYPFGMEMPDRNVNGADYRYGFNGKEKDKSFGGTVYDYGFRIYNPAIAKFLSVDPLTKSYPMLTPYQFASNRPIDGIDLDGLEYISFHHYPNGVVEKTEFYKMTDKDIKRLGGTTAGIHNSVAYGAGGKGVVHYYYDDARNRTDERWEMRQTGGKSDFEFHGLYSGPGSVTLDGFTGSENYNFNEQPIDWADAIAKRHDMDYAAVASENYAGYLEDVRTLQADKDMVTRIDALNATLINPFKSNGVEGVEIPLRTSYSTEMDYTILGQRVLINALATYKQWKVDNDLGNDAVYKDNREAFEKAHPAIATILDQTQ